MKRGIRNQITQFGKSYDAIVAFFYAHTSLQMTISYIPVNLLDLFRNCLR
ncbi:hypothetical protein OTSUT76_0342 [Orientia tsutsugamushi str. UT76]|nr:hypothetical protein OTSUT76_0342 [Orientia tsutsugamushi str. UT76]